MTILAGTSAVVTGGETGIGLAIAEALSAAGARILIGGILDSHGREAAVTIRDNAAYINGQAIAIDGGWTAT